MSSGTHPDLSQALSTVHLRTSTIQIGFPEKELRAVRSHGKAKAEPHSNHSTHLAGVNTYIRTLSHKTEAQATEVPSFSLWATP